MKKRLFVVLVLAVCSILITSCRHAAPRDYEETPTEFTEMTEREKDLLCKVYPNEEMIREGNLFDYERDALNMLRAGKEYIDSRYPSCSFTVISIEPANKFYPWMTLQVEEASYGAARVTVTPEDGGYSFGESFYGNYFREQYDAELERILADKGIETVAFTDFPNVLEGVGESTSISDLLGMKSNLNRKTHLYIADVAERVAIVEQLNKTLSEEGVYGTYTVYFVPEGIADSVEALESERDGYEHKSFNCFDV